MLQAPSSKLPAPRGSRSFTLIEMLVSVGIFLLLTALLVSKYGNFNSSVLLTDQAYQVALAIRTAQTYGVSVKNSDSSSTNFSKFYGVDFDVAETPSGCTDAEGGGVPCPEIPATPDRFTLFSMNYASDGEVDEDTYTPIRTYKFTNGAKLIGVCIQIVGLPCGVVVPLYGGGYQIFNSGHIQVFFARPDPEAHIALATNSCLTYYRSNGQIYGGICSDSATGEGQSVQIVIQSPSGDTRSVNVTRSGQITIGN